MLALINRAMSTIKICDMTTLFDFTWETNKLQNLLRLRHLMLMRLNNKEKDRSTIEPEGIYHN